MRRNLESMNILVPRLQIQSPDEKYDVDIARRIHVSGSMREQLAHASAVGVRGSE